MIDNSTKKAQVNEYSLNTIYFYLTEDCNLACRHCWIAPKYQRGNRSELFLSLEHFKLIVKQAKPLGLSRVKLTGGEPLLHPQIHEILEVVRSEGLNLTVETNGVLCTAELAQKMAECQRARVSVSIDGSDAETHEWIRGVPGCFESALEGTRNLILAGIKPQIIMSIMRHNKDQIESVVRLAETLKVGSVKFNIVQPTARGEKMHRDGETLTIEELVELGKLVENGSISSKSLSIIYSHPAAFQPLSKIFCNNGDGCLICGILGILGVLADGSYALCGIGETVTEMVFGHVASDNLENVWRHTDVLNELREGLTGRFKGICSDCLMKDLCQGFCIAQNYYGTRDLWSPFWYCEEARKAGLFPDTRLHINTIPA